MNKKILWILLIVLLAALVVAAVHPRPNRSEPTAETTAATTLPETTEAPQTTETTEATEPTEPEPVLVPDFTVLDWDGNEVKLSDYLGKPIVLNFWAHWCGPCQREMPEFNATYEALNGEVTFLMLHVGEDVEEGKEKVTEGGYSFPVLFDADSEVTSMYGISAFPTSLFINAEGRLKAYYIGTMDKELLDRGIEMIYTAEE